jgi:hypothetical protein
MANEKDVRDAAGNLIGKVKADVVRDPFGNVIGEVGPPEPEPGPSAEERIAQGLEQKITDAKLKMVSIIDGPMTENAKMAQALWDKASQWSVAKRLEATEKRAELHAKFLKTKAELNELRNAAQSLGGLSTPFFKTIDAHLKHLERHFTEEAPFDLHRF